MNTSSSIKRERDIKTLQDLQKIKFHLLYITCTSISIHYLKIYNYIYTCILYCMHNFNLFIFVFIFNICANTRTRTFNYLLLVIFFLLVEPAKVRLAVVKLVVMV